MANNKILSNAIKELFIRARKYLDENNIPESEIKEAIFTIECKNGKKAIIATDDGYKIITESYKSWKNKTK